MGLILRSIFDDNGDSVHNKSTVQEIQGCLYKGWISVKPEIDTIKVNDRYPSNTKHTIENIS